MKVTWVLPRGDEVVAEVAEGTSLMEAAVANNVAGVDGECGGSLSCATCHVQLDADWQDRAGEVGEFEDVMLDMVEDRSDTSRLSCQIRMSPALDGIRVTVPEAG